MEVGEEGEQKGRGLEIPKAEARCVAAAASNETAILAEAP